MAEKPVITIPEGEPPAELLIDDHRRIFRHIGKLIQMGRPADVVTVYESVSRTTSPMRSQAALSISRPPISDCSASMEWGGSLSAAT